VTKTLKVVLQETFKVPNVITVNGDGINDLWIIPNTYSLNKDINVVIYNSKGEEVLNVFDYQNNWPTSSMAFAQQNMVFYYMVKTAKEVLKQGTITVIR
jgi:gliding motility-associated-like protein